MTDPRGFFTEMPQAGGLQEPLVFLAACAGLNALGTLLVRCHLGRAFASLSAWPGVRPAAALTLVAQHLFEGRAGFGGTPSGGAPGRGGADRALLGFPGRWRWLPTAGIPANIRAPSA